MTALRREARKLVDQLALTSPWSIDDVCAQVGRLRGREVVVEQASRGLAGSATATVRRERERDVITYRPDHHNPDHLIAHELGHLLAGHLDGPTRITPGVSPDLAKAVATMSRACAYESHEERLAEAIADQLMATARQHSDARSSAATTRLRGFGEAMR